MGIKKSDLIDVLGFSTRTYNALRRSNVHSVGDFLVKSEGFFIEIKGIGAKSLKEIEEKRIFLEEKIQKNPIPFEEMLKENVDIIFNTPIKDLVLSVSLYEELKSRGVERYFQLLKLTDKELMNIRDENQLLYNEVLHVVEKIFLERTKEIRKNRIFEFEEKTLEYINSLATLLKIDVFHLKKYLSTEYAEEVDGGLKNLPLEIEENEALIKLYKHASIEELIGKIVFDIIGKEAFGITEEKLLDKLPEPIRNSHLLNRVLNSLEHQDKIVFGPEDRFLVKLASFNEGIKEIFPKRESNILLSRAQGKTLEEIAAIYGVTRERIRQIEGKVVRSLNRQRIYYKEDRYREIFLTYDFSKEEFIEVFGSEETLSYLNLRYKDDKAKLLKAKEEFFETYDLPLSVKQRLSSLANKYYVTIGDERVRKEKEEIFYYAVKTYARNNVTVEEFVDVYNILLDDLDIKDDIVTPTNFRTYAHKTLNSKFTLSRRGNQFRYYNMDSYDFTSLYEELDLKQYKDVEFSALKFFRQCPELMKSYDIRDEYELHNLLKKTCTQDMCSNINFGRMPTIEFGKVDRSKQVKDFLQSVAPISKDDFCNRYEEEYGFLARTVAGSHLHGIEKYFDNNIYDIGFYDFPEDYKAIIKTKLAGDIYTMDKVKEIINNAFPSLDYRALNQASLRGLGFKRFEGYMIRDTYESSSSFFNNLLTKDDVLDVAKLPADIRRIKTYIDQLYSLRRKLEIIEFEPGKYVNFSRLEAGGISKEDLYSFRKKVKEFLGDGHYFTMQSIKHMGFEHDLFELGFDDWFYSSILAEDRENFSYIRVSNNRLLYCGNYSFNFSEFIENIVYEEDNMYIDIFDLEDLLRDRYNIRMNKNRIINAVKSTAMHYDNISERIFADYDTYFEVI